MSLCMRVILMVMSLVPPTGTRSLPVVNSRNFFCSSSLYASSTLWDYGGKLSSRIGDKTLFEVRSFRTAHCDEICLTSQKCCTVMSSFL